MNNTINIFWFAVILGTIGASIEWLMRKTIRSFIELKQALKEYREEEKNLREYLKSINKEN